MTYAKYISKEQIEYPNYMDHPFKDIPNARTNDKLHRLNGYLPLSGDHQTPEGYVSTPIEFTLVQQSETHKELRDKDPLTGERFIVKEYNESNVEIGEHVEMREVDVTVDTSYIQIDAWQDVEKEEEITITTRCTKYELINCLKEFYPELLAVLKNAYDSSADLAFYWNTVLELDRDNEDFKNAVNSLGITDEQLDAIFAKIER